MSDQDPQELLGRCETVVAKALASGADQAEVYWTREVELDLEIESNAVSNTGRSRTSGGSIRIVRDGRVGFAYLTRIEDSGRAIDQALSLSRLAPKTNLELPQPAAAPTLPNRWDDDTAQLDVHAALELGMRLLAAREEQCPEGQIAGGGVSLGWSIEALANSHGVALSDRATDSGVGLNLVLEDGERSLNAWDSQNLHIGTPAPEDVFAPVAKDLLSLRNPQPADGGSKDIVFRPDAVSELVTNLISSAVDGDDAMRGKSVWSERLGEQVADVGLNVIDDPLREGCIGVAPWDGDGLPAKATDIIRDGELKSFMFDLRDGQEHNQPSTHSGVRSSFKSPPETGNQHVILEGSQTSMDALVGGVDDGYLVESLLGAHTANATTGDFSVTAPNVWRIEKGEVTGAAQEIAIGGNLPELLGRLDGMGPTRRMNGAWIPPLRFRDVPVSA